MAGPLIPGLEEFDRPRRGPRPWVWWLAAVFAAVVVLVLVGGLIGGVGPLRSLGLSTMSLQPISYRPTSTDQVIQIAVALPSAGMCKGDQVVVTPFERGGAVEVLATLTRPRNASCTQTGILEDRVWVDVPLRSPLDLRSVVREADGIPLQREAN